MIAAARSTTYQHLLRILHTEWPRFEPAAGNGPRRVVRILDAGCGDGYFLGYLMENLPVLRPGVCFELYGFDVSDHEAYRHDYVSVALRALCERFPDVPWSERVRCISEKDSWPFPPEHFDVIFSNQVLEHVRDHDAFFGEVARTLKPDGFSAHLFPLRDCWLEVHLLVPFAHWIGNDDLAVCWIRLANRMGMGKFRREQHARPQQSLDEYARDAADYVANYTNYVSYADAIRIGRRHGLRVGFRYTREFYTSRARALLRRGGSDAPPHPYRSKHRSGASEWLYTWFLRRLSCVTLFFERAR